MRIHTGIWLEHQGFTTIVKHGTRQQQLPQSKDGTSHHSITWSSTLESQYSSYSQGRVLHTAFFCSVSGLRMGFLPQRYEQNQLPDNIIRLNCGLKLCKWKAVWNYFYSSYCISIYHLLQNYNGIPCIHMECIQLYTRQHNHSRHSHAASCRVRVFHGYVPWEGFLFYTMQQVNYQFLIISNTDDRQHHLL